VIRNLCDFSEKKFISILFLYYLIAHGGILFILNAIYWDDWVLYNVNQNIIFDKFNQAGKMFNISGYMHNYFLLAGPWIYKVITFLLMFFAGILLNYILKRHQDLSTEARFLVVLFFLVLPFYHARVALIDIGYTISYFLFFLAWFMMSKNRILSLILFFISFNTNSLLVFFLLPFLDSYWHDTHSKNRFNYLLFVNFCIKKIDFVALPFLYFIIKVYYYSPFGLYENYNEQYSIANLIKAPIIMIIEWSRLEIAIIPVFLLLFIIVYLNRRVSSFDNLFTKIKTSKLLIAAIIAFVSGVFPYWILGHIPTFAEWSSRHQLLLPLSFSLIFVFLIKFISFDLRRYYIATIISVSLVANLSVYISFYIDWKKQTDLIVLMSSNNILKQADLVVFDDLTQNLNAIDRKYRPYEWNGLMAEAFAEESRFGIDSRDKQNFIQGSMYQGYFSHPSHYKASSFSNDKSLNAVSVKIHRNSSMLKALFNGDYLISIEVTPLPNILVAR